MYFEIKYVFLVLQKNAITYTRTNTAFFLLEEEKEEEKDEEKKEKETILFINWMKIWPDMMIPLITAPDIPIESYNKVSENMDQKSLGSGCLGGSIC